MKITRITCRYDRKVSDGRYGSMGFSCEMTAELDEFDDANEAYQQLAHDCREGVKAQMLPTIQRTRSAIGEIFEHLPSDIQEKIRGLIEEGE